MLPASLAAVVPVFMATPTSAWARAGASLVPSPVMATSLPPSCSCLDQRHLRLGRGLGQEVVDAGLLGDGRRGEGVVAGDHHGADAHLAHLVELLLDALLHHVLELDDPEDDRTVGHHQRRGPGPRDALDDRRRGRRARSRPARPTHRLTESAAPLRIWRPSMSRPDMRVVAEKGTKTCSASRWRSRMSKRSLARTTMERPSGVSSASEASWAASATSCSRVATDGEEVRRHPVAQGDGARLVQQQRLHVAGRLHGPAAHGEHVALDQAVHAGDADGREQGADGGRDQADQQGDQDDHRDRGAGVDGRRPGARRRRG